MSVNNTNWNAIWRDGIIFFAGKSDKAESWNRAASRWNKEEATDYREKVMKRIKVKPDCTVLDVGCGPGLLAIPLAKRCNHLTALDISCEMLKYLKHNAEQEKVANITCINMPFENAFVGKDIEKHDIVIASRSMGWEYNLEKFLRNMHNAAEKRAYVIWGADDRPFDIGLYKAIGRSYGETRTYIVIYNLLYQMGIRANIEIFQTKANAITYKSVDEASSELIKRFERRNTGEQLKESEVERLNVYLKESLVKSENGVYRFGNNRPAKHALIWWDKKLNS
jgi:SAM-dependent methyltransferase